MIMDLFHKTNRHDNSITEAEKIEFRKSEDWKYFRNQVAEHQNYKDYITGEDLKEDWNCHHLCMINSQYKILELDRFIAVNKKTHEEIHRLYKTNWKNTIKSDNKFYSVLKKMDELNDDYEIFLYENKIDYIKIDPSNKYRNRVIAMENHYPVNEKGYLQWHKRYLPEEIPQDTEEWLHYMSKINNNKKNEFFQLILELRHMNLYSSYKNFRNNPNYSQTTKEECKIELEKTTKILKKCFKEIYK